MQMMIAQHMVDRENKKRMRLEQIESERRREQCQEAYHQQHAMFLLLYFLELFQRKNKLNAF